MELKRASLTQVEAGRGGRLVAVEDDVADMVARIKELDPNLSVHWNDDGEYFQIKERCEDGRDRLVTTSLSLDQRLLDHLRMIGSEHWDAGAEMERHERERDKRINHEFHEEIGPKAEWSAFALRKDVEAKNRIFLPRGIFDGA